MPDILEAIEACFSGTPGFQLFNESGCNVLIRDPFGEIIPTNSPVFIRLGRNADDIITLLSMLRRGIVPVILPDTISAYQYRSLRERYSFIGQVHDNEITPASNPADVLEGVFLVVATSGSTGEPKLVCASKQALTSSIQAIHSSQQLSCVNSTGISLPVCYSFSLINQLLWAVLYQRRLDLLPNPVFADAFVQGIADRESEMLCMVNTNAVQLAGVDHRTSSAVKVVNFAGAPFPIDQFDALQRVFPNARFYNNYGCTEAMPRLATTQVCSSEHSVRAVGKAVEGVELKVDNQDGQITFRSKNAAIGELKPDGSIAHFDEWILSGDCGDYRHGELYVDGRNDDIVTVNGERHSLLNVDEAFRDLGALQAFSWIKEQSVAVALQVPEGLELNRSNIGKMVRERLPRNLWPKRVVALSDWPMLGNGKVDRKLIKTICDGDVGVQRII